MGNAYRCDKCGRFFDVREEDAPLVITFSRDFDVPETELSICLACAAEPAADDTLLDLLLELALTESEEPKP